MGMIQGSRKLQRQPGLTSPHRFHVWPVAAVLLVGTASFVSSSASGVPFPEQTQAAAPAASLAPASLNRPVHVMFTFVDHWEPGTGTVAVNKSRMWLDDYGAFARRHADADGRPPQHDWFCKNLEKDPLQLLAQAAFQGLGEMNVHIHHGTENDTFRDNTAEMDGLLRFYCDYLNQVGACLTLEKTPRVRFAFIHGMWALDNSRLEDGVRKWCGVNREIDVLLNHGCYADFTFPCSGTMSPRFMPSKIFYSRDSNLPKSYDYMTLIQEAAVGRPPAPDELTLIQGPNTSTNIDATHPPTLNEMERWMERRVLVAGRLDWVFIKVYTHSAQDLGTPEGRSNLFGDVAEQFYSDLERVYNDGTNYALHYCTAREAYNIAMAAAAGREGNPNDYRDFVIPPPPNRFFHCSALARLLRFDAELGEAEFEIVESTPHPPIEFEARGFTPKDRVFEKNKPEEGYRSSDAETTSTLVAPLVVNDPTPSRFYLFQTALLKARHWSLYP